MWQRVQTLYLFVAGVFVALMFFSPAAVILGPGGEEVKIAYTEKLPYLILLSLSAVTLLVTLLCFKRRMLQLRLAAVALILLTAFQVWIAVDYFRSPDDIVFGVSAVFPIVAAILDYLAIRGIFADELMVRNASRLRSAKNKKKAR